MEAILLGEIVDDPWLEFAMNWYDQYPWIGMLLALMVIDVATGLAAAVVQRRLSSKTGWRGMMRKAATVLVIGMAGILQGLIRTTLPEGMQGAFPFPLAKVVAGFFAINECLSILENAKRCGVPLPGFLTHSLVDTFQSISKMGGAQDEHTVELDLTNTKVTATVKDVISDPPSKNS